MRARVAVPKVDLRRRYWIVAVVAAMAGLSWATDVDAGTFEDGFAAYEAEEYEKAYSLWLPLAVQGHEAALFNIGVLYANGQGIAQDDHIAFKWFRRAAETGYPTALLQLGIVHHEGRGVEKNDPVALEYFYRYQEHDEQTATAWANKVYADLFPSAAPRWQAEPVESHRRLRADMLIGQFYEITLTRSYSSADKAETELVEITNGGQIAFIVPLLHRDPQTLDDGERAIVKSLGDQGIASYTYGQYQGMAGADGLLIALDDATVVSISAQSREAAVAYLEAMDLERVRDTIEKISIGVTWEEKPVE